MIQIVAIIAIVVFTFVCVLVGIISSRKTNSVEGFFLAGRSLGPWVAAFSYGTAYFSAVIFIGYAGMFGWTIGLSSILIGVGNAIVGCLLPWIVLARRARGMTQRLDARTMPEFFEKRFLDKKMKTFAAVIIFVFLVPYAAGVYKGLGSLFSAIFNGVSPIVCMLVVAVITGAYLVLGGYVATAWNDFIQGIIMFIGITLMVGILVSRPEVGGFSGMVERLSNISPDLVKIPGGELGRTLLINICLTSMGVWGLPQMVHKFYAIRDNTTAKRATVISTVFALFIGCGAYLVGSMGRLFISANSDGMPNTEGGFDGVVPEILMKALTHGVLPIIVLCIIMVLLLSASMSTLASLVLSSSSAIAIDIIGSVKPDIKQNPQMRMLRLCCGLFILLSFIFASLKISFIVNLMSFSWGVVAGAFIGPFIWGLYGRFVTKAGAWAGLLSGPVVVGLMLIFNTAVSGFEAAKSMAPVFGVTAMVVSLIIVPVVSVITRRLSMPKDKVDDMFIEPAEVAK